MKIIDNESAIRTMTSDLKSTLRLLNGACRDRRIEPRDGCAYLKEHKLPQLQDRKIERTDQIPLGCD